MKKSYSLAEKELLKVRDDFVNSSKDYHGFQFLETATHGFLVVPKNNTLGKLARFHCAYDTENFYFLEEDMEMHDFLDEKASILFLLNNVDVSMLGNIICKMIKEKEITIERLCNFFGWNGGTIHQVVAEFKKLLK